MRCVIDNNVLISHLLLPDSVPARAVRAAISHHTLLMSEALLLEFGIVLCRAKFDPYVSLDKRKRFLRELNMVSEPVSIIRRIDACRDPADNAVLELAVNGGAHCIVTGDKDLLILHPFRAVSIYTPAQFVAVVN